MTSEALTPIGAVQELERETKQISKDVPHQLEQVAQQLEQQVQEYAFVVTSEHGLHARPAIKIVNLLGERYKGQVSMFYRRFNPEIGALEKRNGDEVNPRSVLGLMSAALPQRSMVYFRFQNGQPSKELVEAIKDTLDDYYLV